MISSYFYDEVVTNKLIETVNNDLLLKKVISNINKNKSSIELFEDGILTKSELAERVKKLNEEIDTLKFRLDELKQELKNLGINK